MKITKYLVFTSLVILCILVSSPIVFSQGDELRKTQDLVRNLICLLFWIIPALMSLFFVTGGFLILTGSTKNRTLGKKLIINAVIALIILLALMLFVSLALPDIDIMVCFGAVPVVENQPPIAEARVSYHNPKPSEKYVEITLGDKAYFDASLSRDPDGVIVKYIWDFGDGTYAEGISVEHNYTQIGEYYVKLRVIDDKGAISPIPSTVRVIVNPPLQAKGEVIPFPPGTTTTSTIPPWITTTTGPITTTTSPITTTTGPITTTTGPITTTTGPVTTTTILNCLDIRSCPECIAAGCEWCQDPEMGPSHCTSDCDWTCHGGTCYTDNCDFPTTSTTSTSTTTTIDLPCNESYAYACAGYCDDPDEKCVIVDTHCECKEYVTPCDEFKATGKLPKKFNWKNWKGKNFMTPVRSQGSCGSCWAFSAVGAMEGTYKVEQWNPALNPNLAEQYLVSTCCNSCGSCSGGWPWVAFAYIRSSGISDEACFPYIASDCSCSRRCGSWSSRLWKISSYAKVSRSRDKIKEALICDGPLSVCVMPWPGSRYGHAVTLSGWDDDMTNCMLGRDGNGCWIIKNSWGIHRGDHGYYTIGYGTNHIEDYVYSPDGVTPPP